MGRPAKYPPEFRREAIAVVKSSGRGVAEVARSLEIAEGTLWNWVKIDREALERAADPEALSESEREELKRLRKKAAQQEIDLEILRKATADSGGLHRLADWKLKSSYDSIGDAYDNAAMEAFWATLKKEVHHI